ncbi:MAG: DUF3078 domain-containing protein [Bacteroidales bacterium]|nr:DUF3078 domain-containing protein [Bacteroidales bacterium]
MKKLYTIGMAIAMLMFFQHAKCQELIDVTKQAQSVSSLVDKDAENPWEFGAGFQVIINQSYSKNWVGASNPAIGGQVLGNMYLRYQKNKLAWENTLDLDYGMRATFNPKPPKGIGTKLEKVSDNLDFKSKLGLKAGGYWYYGAMFTFNTQLTKGYDANNEEVLNSSFMTPGYLTLSIGMDYKRKMWSWYISPIGVKMVTKTNPVFFEEDKFGVSAYKKLYTAVGASTHIVFNADIHPKIKLYAKLELFYDYLNRPAYLDKYLDENKEHITYVDEEGKTIDVYKQERRKGYNQVRNMDARFDMTWMFNITEWLSLSLKVALLYDYDVRFNVYDADGNQLLDRDPYTGEIYNRTTDHLQFQEAFGLTLGYKFQIPKKK